MLVGMMKGKMRYEGVNEEEGKEDKTAISGVCDGGQG